MLYVWKTGDSVKIVLYCRNSGCRFFVLSLFISIVNAYGLNGMATDAIKLYRRMPKELIDPKAHVCVLNACSHSGLTNEARSIFETILIKNQWIYTAMVVKKNFHF